MALQYFKQYVFRSTVT